MIAETGSPTVVQPDRFFTPEQLRTRDTRRLQELHVLTSELAYLSVTSRLFRSTSGGPGSVAVLSTDTRALKSGLRHELDQLKRQLPAHEQQELNF